MKNADRVDVVVVGSGAGGSPVALDLAQSGAKVVVLEKGPFILPEKLFHDEIAKRRHFMVPDPREEPHTLRSRENEVAQRTSEGWTANIVGGGTVHYSGFLYRMHPVDLRLRSTMGPVEGADLVDWPISYDELAPFYDRVEVEVGASGRWKSHPFEEPRKADYPLEPLEEDPIAKSFDVAAARLGMHPFPTPRAILSRPYRGRSACSYCRMCAGYGCPTGAKGSTLTALLPYALASGRCEIRDRCMATEVLLGANGRAEAVVYRDADDVRQVVRARVVVLACTAVETARLLLSSRSSHFPDGLANRNGRVGKGVVFSCGALGSALLARPRTATSPHHSVQRSIQDFYFTRNKDGGASKGGTLGFTSGFVDPIFMAEATALPSKNAPPLWGVRLKEKLRRRFDEASIHFESFCEFFANDHTYVDLDPIVQDRWGAPVARMTVRTHPESQAAMALMATKASDVLEAMDEVLEVNVTTPESVTKFLQGGTCRFGTEPETSVLDSSCRAHDVPNLYVTDGSFMPTSGGVPPTMTIMANAFRVAGIMVDRLREGAL